jgi:hypothetical protein
MVPIGIKLPVTVKKDMIHSSQLPVDWAPLAWSCLVTFENDPTDINGEESCSSLLAADRSMFQFGQTRGFLHKERFFSTVLPERSLQRFLHK